MTKRVKLRKKVKRDPHRIVVWTKRPAKIIARGAQATEIKWLDTGSSQVLANDQLIFDE